MCPEQGAPKHPNWHHPFFQLHFRYDLYESLCRSGDLDLRRAIQNERVHFPTVYDRPRSRVFRLQLGRLPDPGVPVGHLRLRLAPFVPNHRLRLPLRSSYSEPESECC